MSIAIIKFKWKKKMQLIHKWKDNAITMLKIGKRLSMSMSMSIVVIRFKWRKKKKKKLKWILLIHLWFRSLIFFHLQFCLFNLYVCLKTIYLAETENIIKFKINITIYFENLIIEFYIIYALNTHVKFCANWILFIIWHKLISYA